MRRGMIALGTAFLSTTSALAQQSGSPALTTPPVAPPRVAEPVVPPPEATPLRSVVPAEAASIWLTPASVTVIGGLPALASEERALVAPLEGAEISASQLFETAAKIEAMYAAKGYVLVRAVVPPQNLAKTGAAVRINIINGRVAGADVAGLPHRVHDVVSRHVARMTDRPWLTRTQLERALLLAGDAAGIALRTTIEPGREAGTVRLVLAGAGPALSVDAGFDNAVGGALGGSVFTLSPVLRSALGGGETIYGIVGGAPFDGFVGRNSPRRFAALGVVVPIGRDGLRFSTEGLVARTRPIVPTGVLATESRYVRTAFKLSYPLIRSRARDLTIEAGLDLVDERQIARDFGVLLYQDRLRPLRLRLRYAARLPGASYALSGELSQGIAGLGARDARNASLAEPVSRTLAPADFTKVEVTLDAVSALAGRWTVAARAQGQASLGGPLFGSEQMAITGPRALSGYDLGGLSGDNAAFARVELRYGFDLGKTATFEPYAFGASGVVQRLQPTAVETGVIHAASLGAGARVTVATNGRPFRIEGEIARGFSDTLSGNWRFNIGVTVSF